MVSTQSGDEDRDSLYLPGMAPEPGSEPPNGSGANAHMNPETNQVELSAPVLPAANHGQNGTARARATVEDVDPVWLRRSKLVIFVATCIYLGVVLIILPWVDVWTQNGLIHRYPMLHDLAMNNFVRGAISGVGIVNIGTGIWEAVTYREGKK
jgi:hypothetical protein